MAKELIHFQNFAKLKDTEVAFNDITVLAGKPGTGKSYVMKMMYAIDEAYYRKSNNTLVLEFIEDNKAHLMNIANLFLSDDKDKLVEVEKFIKENNFTDYQKYLKEYFSTVTALESTTTELIHRIERLKSLPITDQMVIFLSNIIKSIFSDYNQISDHFSLKNKDLEIKLVDKNLEFNFERIIDIDNSTVVFVETPLILEFKKFIIREEGKTPYHLESLLKILDTDYSFTDETQEQFIKEFTKRSKEIIEGDIESSSDSFSFNKENGKNYDIVNTSSGTKSIGLLQYLVTNKALKKGSVLYWEEPEVHLHPEWQLRMIELFVELMNAGVKIIFSTHSPYMCDYLNAISQKKGFDNRVSFNLLEETENIVNNYILESDEDWNRIQAELLDPLEEIMWEYI